MGVVYVAHRPLESRLLVLKRLIQSPSDAPEHFARFQQEVDVGRLLNHPNLIRFEDADLAAPEPYLVMEHMAGVGLGELYRRYVDAGQRVPTPLAAFIVSRLFGALAYMHRFSVGDDGTRLLHRDVSMSNVMVGFDGSVKLIDYGLSRFDAASRVTRAGQVFGTQLYMAPELAFDGPGERRLDARYDVFSASMLAYDILTNGRANLFRRVDVRQMMLSLAEVEKLPAANTLVPELGAELAEVLRRGMRHQPGDRWADAGELDASFRRAAAPFLAAARAEDLGAAVQQLFPGQWIETALWAANAEGYRRCQIDLKGDEDEAVLTAVCASPFVEDETGGEGTMRVARKAVAKGPAEALIRAFEGRGPVVPTSTPTLRRPGPSVGLLAAGALALLLAGLAIGRVVAPAGGNVERVGPEIATRQSPSASPSAVPQASPSAELIQPVSVEPMLSRTPRPSPTPTVASSPPPSTPAPSPTKRVDEFAELMALARKAADASPSAAVRAEFFSRVERLASTIPEGRRASIDAPMRRANRRGASEVEFVALVEAVRSAQRGESP